jgi:hypothetical protein
VDLFRVVVACVAFGSVAACGAAHADNNSVAPATPPSQTSPTASPHGSKTASSATQPVPFCRATSLAITEGGQQAALVGAIEYYFTIRNDGHHTCRLRGYPKQLEGFRNGRWHELTFGRDTPLDVDELAENAPIGVQHVVLQPGRAALLLMSAEHANGYRPNLVYQSLRVSFVHVQHWLTANAHLEPDGGLSVGPVRDINLNILDPAPRSAR